MNAHQKTVPSHAPVLALSRLVQLEWEIRQADTPASLDFLAVNDTHRVVPYDHALAWRRQGRCVTAVSGGLRIEPNAPQIVWFSQLGAHLHAQSQDRRRSVPAPSARPAGGNTPQQAAGDAREMSAVPIDLQSLPQRLKPDFARWITGRAVWVPFTSPGRGCEGGLFILRDTPFNEGERILLGRIGNAYGHALSAVSRSSVLGISDFMSARPWSKLPLLAAVLLVPFLPMRMSVLADARVTPLDPVLVSAPLDGVIKEVTVRPNQSVQEGAALFAFDATELEAARDVAQKRVEVLAADRERAQAQAFKEPKARAELGLLSAKLAEGEAELRLARDRLARIAVRAPSAGVVLLDDPNAWIGRPVKVGERVMSLADPSHVRLEIQIPVDDALVVTPGAEVDFFLAVRPSDPVRARLTKVSFEPRVLPNQSVAFVAEAEFIESGETPRLGLTGTAKVLGERTSLVYLLARRPLASVRRVLGF